MHPSGNCSVGGWDLAAWLKFLYIAFIFVFVVDGRYCTDAPTDWTDWVERADWVTD